MWKSPTQVGGDGGLCTVLGSHPRKPYAPDGNVRRHTEPYVRIYFLRLFLILFPLVGIVAGGEAIIRLTAPQNLTGTWLDPDPDGLVLNRPRHVTQHQWGDRIVTYRFNSLHQRGPEPAEGVSKLLVLGDSVAFGWLLREDDSTPRLIQKAVDRDWGEGRVQVLNAAAGGWGTASYTAYLERFGETIEPLAVLVLANTGDVIRSTESKLYAWREGALGRELVFAPRPPSGIRFQLRRLSNGIPGYHWLLTHSHLFQFVRNLTALGLTRFGTDQARHAPGPLTLARMDGSPELRDLARALFRRIKAWCDSHNAKLYVLSQYLRTRPADNWDWFSRIMAEEGIPFLDLQPPMVALVGERHRDYFLPGDPHPNERVPHAAMMFLWPWLKPRLEPLLP